MMGKAAVVTGSTSGIGLGIAKALAAEGMGIMLNGFGDAAEIAALCRDIGETHEIPVHHSAADMADPEAVAAMIGEANAAFGQVDVLVNNAGIQHVAPVEDLPPEKWDAIIAINLSAAFHTIRAVLPGMKERGWGRIVNVASAHGLVASPFKSAYVAAKHGLTGLTKAVALEVAEAGITVNALCPGYVRTPLVERQIPDTARARGLTAAEVVRDVMLAAQPTKRFVDIADLAALTVFLCGDHGASVTGATLSMDGGWVAQ